MAELDFRTATTQIEEALQSTIALNLQTRLTVANATALAALLADNQWHLTLARLTSTGYVWRFDRYSQAIASASVIVPASAPTAGRWLLTASTITSGYLKAVKLYDGEVDEAKVMTWLFGQVPSSIIVWEGEDYEPKSGGSNGALYLATCRFTIWGISRNLRAEKQGVLGSQIASEATADPGVNRIIGDLRRYLAGSTLGQDGVVKTEITTADRVMSTQTAERGHIYALRVNVYATYHNTIADEQDNPAVDLDRIDATYQLASEVGAGGTEYASDYAAGSGGLTGITGLTATMPALTVTIDGTDYSPIATGVTFGASVDAYRYVTTGAVWSVVEVASGAAMPTTPAGALLVAVTTTNASAITLDRSIAAHLYNLGLVDLIDTTD